MPHFWLALHGSRADRANQGKAGRGHSGAWDGDEPNVGDSITLEDGTTVMIDDKKPFVPPPQQDARNPYKKKLLGHEA
jgi:hypothetical protein